MEIYQDKSYPVETRIKDLLSKMTIEEKVRQIDQYSSRDITVTDPETGVCSIHRENMVKTIGTESLGVIQNFNTNATIYNEIQKYAIENTRLGIPILFCQEALHGFLQNGATVFPQQLSLASTFDPELGEKMGEAIAREARACGIQETWNPVCDLAREPRWGRTEESLGEDTYLSSRFAYHIVKGLQGNDISRKDKVASQVKHYTGYGVPQGGHNCAAAAIGKHEMYEYCQPVFEAAIKEAGAYNAMASYSSIDGQPVPSDHELLTEVLRNEWNMRGFVRSDMCAITMLNYEHKVAESSQEAIRMAVEAGTDVQLYDYPHDLYQNSIIEHISTGRMSIETLNQAVSRVLRVKYDLGLFDDPYIDEKYQQTVFHCEAHKKLAYDIAKESITLLKNEKDILPLSKEIKKIAVIGPSADDLPFGDYSVSKDGYDRITLVNMIKQAVSKDTEVLYAKGCDYIPAKLTKFSPQCYRFNNTSGFKGEYYNNDDLSGDPVLVRNDPQIDFSFIATKAAESVNSRFSARWTGTLKPDLKGEGQIGFNCEDSVRLWIDGALILDAWEEKKGSKTVPFQFDKDIYQIIIEYKNDERGAILQFGFLPKETDLSEAVSAAKKSDVAIVSVGDFDGTSGENFDRSDLNLPGKQLDMVKEIYKTGTPVILILQTGRPLSIIWESSHIPAIVQAFFSGEFGAKAITDVLFGNINPSGRLPVSFPKSVGQLPVYYSRKPAGGKKYIEGLDNEALYPFGFGLSYTQFEYSKLKLSSETIHCNEKLRISFHVKNTGKVAGTAVPQIYVCDYFASVVKPEIELKGFERIDLKPGEEKEVSIVLGELAFRTLNPQFKWVVEPGKMCVYVGSDSKHLILSSDFEISR